MRADDDVHRAVRETVEDRLALLGPHPTGEELQRERSATREHRVVAHGEALDVTAQRRHVLLGQHLGRREDDALAPAVECCQHRRQGDHGLARTDVTLQQSVHRFRARHVLGDLGEHPTLRRRQDVVVTCEESPNERILITDQDAGLDVERFDVEVVRDARRGLIEAPASQGDEQLEAPELVEGQSPARRRRAGEVPRKVDARIGPRPIDEVEVGSRRLVDRVEERSGATERLFYEATHLPTRQPRLSRRRVDGDDATDLRGIALLARRADNHVDDGIGHLTLTLVVADLAKEECLDPEGELLLAPRLIEEDHPQRVEEVAHHHLDDRPTLARPTRLHRLHLPEDRGLVADVEIREVDPLRAIDVAPGVDGEQVEDGLDAERRQCGGTLLANVTDSLDRDVA